MAALELVSDKKTGSAKNVVQKVQDVAYEAGVLARTSGSHVIVSPSLIVTREYVARILEALDAELKAASVSV